MSHINGVVVGLVTDVNDPDKKGRVKVHFPWLHEDHTTDWIRVATLMSGKGRGSFFMPEVRDEVLVAFEHGDPRFPFVVGYMWNGQDEPPNSDIDVKVRRLKTVSGHIIEFDDRQNQEHVLIKTKGGHHLLLDDKSGQPRIELFDQQGHNTLTIDTQANKIEVTSQQGDITLKAPTGKITLDAMQIAVKSQATTTVEAQGAMQIKSQAALSVQSQAALTVQSQAAMQLSAQAALQVSANAAAQIQSSGVMTLRGSLIMLN